MGLMDDAQQWVQEGEQLAKQHPDQVKEGLEKVEQALEQQTGGQYNSQIEAAGDKAEGFLGNQ